VRRITLWLIVTVAVVALLFSYRASNHGATATGRGRVGESPGIVGGPPVPTATGGTPPCRPGSGPSMRVNGQLVRTSWGPVQVRATISSGRIVDVEALLYPSDNERDAAISRSALPVLRQQALAAQSARIDGVSGATVTSDGYRASLQSALDAAHLDTTHTDPTHQSGCAAPTGSGTPAPGASTPEPEPSGPDDDD